MPKNLESLDNQSIPVYAPQNEEADIQKYLKERTKILKNTKKNIAGNVNFENIMRAADVEYQPTALTDKISGKRGIDPIFRADSFDEDIGLRGAQVETLKTDMSDWHSNVSTPTLLIKIQTALAFLIDQNPEAIFKATTKKFNATSELAHSLWKRSWEIGGAREQLKLFIFDLAKYGWAIGRTYPRVIKFEGEVLDEVDSENPQKTKFKKKDIIEYNDIFREKLDPYRTWLDDMTNLTDPWSCDDWYHEKDYSWDSFNREFKNYENSQYIKPGMTLKEENQPRDKNQETDKRQDMVTVGFYESRNKDLYAIFVPEPWNVVIYSSPLPNDNKKLSCWWGYWNERDSRTPYGIGLFELLKGDKTLYDRLNNLSMDALLLAILPMLWYSGSNEVIGSGILEIEPGKIKQKLPGTNIEQTKIDFNAQGIMMLDRIQARINDETGVQDIMAGPDLGGRKKTLGQIIQELQNSLRRLTVPLNNIGHVLENEAYITLSWMKQIYTQAEVRMFANARELAQYEQETGEMANLNVAQKEGKIEAKFYPTLDLHIAQDDEGNLMSSKDSSFFQINPMIPRNPALRQGQLFFHPDDFGWEGRITIKSQSLLNPSVLMQTQQTLELFNLISPLLQLPPEIGAIYVKPLRQVFQQMDKKPDEWFPDEWLRADEMGVEQYKAQKVAKQAQDQNNAQPLFLKGNQSQQAQAGTKPQGGATAVPRGQITNPMRQALGKLGGAPSQGSAV